MFRGKPARRSLASLTALTLLFTLLASPASAYTFRTKGTGQHFYTSWTEYDPDDILGLPGNVHVGFFSGWSDMYGTYFYGNVTDFDCDPGETPYGGGGHGEEAIAVASVQAAENAVDDAIDGIIASGAKKIDANVVVDEVLTQLSEEVPDIVEEETQGCDYLQDRFLSGNDEKGNPTVTITTDVLAKTVTLKGFLTVSNGGHGEPGSVLGTPPINLKITGGEWQKYEWSYSSWGKGYKYSSWQKGTDYYNSTVTGAIGGMGFDDDEDDESYGGFGSYAYRTVEQIRN